MIVSHDGLWSEPGARLPPCLGSPFCVLPFYASVNKKGNTQKEGEARDRQGPCSNISVSAGIDRTD